MKLTEKSWLGAAMRVGLCVMTMCLLAAPGRMAQAQAVSTTTVQGTVYLANGQPGAGTLVVSWPAFTTAEGQMVAADSLTVAIPADGFVSVNLAPNQGATPAGQYYTAVFYMSDGTVNTQYWVVPAAAQASLAQVQTQVMPASQAVQAVSKAYVDQAVTEAVGNQLAVAGGTLTGPLYLNGDPTQPLQAADKHYVDQSVAQAVPLAGGGMTGGLTTPAVNGVQSPATGSSQTTLQAAVNAAGTSGAVEIPPTYAGTDTFTNLNGVDVTDLRTTGAQPAARSVKEFGAVCDGVTDDTNALQEALDYAHTHNVALTIPQGICKTRQLSWHGESISGVSEQTSALMGFPGEDVLASMPDSGTLMANTRIHDLTIYVDQSVDESCSPAEGVAPAGDCSYSRPMESNSIFSKGGDGLTGTTGSGAAWDVGNCAIAMPAQTGTGGNGLRNASFENVAIVATGTDPVAAQYPGAHSTHTCGLYLAQWPQSSDFKNIQIRGVNTGIAIPALPVAAPAGLTADANRWQNITIEATHAFTAAAGSNNVLDNVTALADNSAATAEPPTGIVLDLSSGQQGWTVRNAVVQPMWDVVPPQLTVTASGGAVTAVTVGSQNGMGFDPYGTWVPLAFSGTCTAQATASVNSDGSLGTVTVTQGGTGCSSTTTASVHEPGTWDTAAPVNLIGGQNMSLFGGNLLKGNGGYTVWDANESATYGTQLDGGGGNLPGGGTYQALVANAAMGSTYKVDQFPGADFGAKLEACLSAVNPTYGGTCDARNFTGTLAMGSNLTIATPNTTVDLPCATIATANQVIVTAGTRNVSLRGCALRGGSAANGDLGGTVFEYSGTGAMIQVGDAKYAADTMGFHLDNVAINTTGATSATAEGLAAYRTQEMDLESLYFLGNENQTGMTLDGTGNYTGGTFYDDAFNGFGTAVNAIGHQVANSATTDWMNASTFVRLHIDCPTSGGSPIAGTVGINLLQGDGNTFTGGDVEGCSTALHLGPNAENNTIIGLRNENSTDQVVADTGSSYNSWITGGTMFTGALTDNGTRNSFLDTFHRSFNGINGDWYGSQVDATITNHYRLGIGTGNERGLLKRYQTDYGYRWTTGLSDATAGEQFYEILDELNNVYRLSIGQYNHGQSSTNNQTVLNSAGTGAVVLNGSNNAGTGGVVFGSGGATASTVATIDNAGDAQLNGALKVGGASTFSGSTTVKNGADAEIDSTLWAGLTTPQKESFVYKDWNGSSQWYMVKDASNNWALNSATGGLDSFKAYQSTNSGDTYVDASNSSGTVRINYETGSGKAFNIYGGGSNLYASFTGANAIKFPGLAASSGDNCLQIDNSGYISNTGSPCGSGSGGSGTVGSGVTGQIAYYTANGTTLGGISTIPVSAGGTGGSTASAALANLLPGVSADGNNGISVAGAVTAAASITSTSPRVDIRAYGAKCNGTTDDTAALQAAISALGSNGGTILVPGIGAGCYIANPTQITWPSSADIIRLKIQGTLKLGSTLVLNNNVFIDGESGGYGLAQLYEGSVAQISGLATTGTLGTAVTAGTDTFTPSSMANIYPGTSLTVASNITCSISSIARSSNYVTATLSSSCHIPPGALVAIAGVTDTSYNGTFFAVASDYGQNTVSWNQSGSDSTSAGGTVAGLDEDSIEVVTVTATTSTTATATFKFGHAATDPFGVNVITTPSHSWGPKGIDNISLQNCGGACFAANDTSYLSLKDDSLNGTTAETSIPFIGATVFNALFDGDAFMSAASTTSPSSPWGMIFTENPDNASNQNAGNESSMLTVEHSWIERGVQIDGGGYTRASEALGMIFRDDLFERAASAIRLVPATTTSTNIGTIDLIAPYVQDDLDGFPYNQVCDLTYTTYSGGHGGIVIDNPADTFPCRVNSYFDGSLTAKGTTTSVSLPLNPTAKRGIWMGAGIVQGEIDGIGAAFAPSLIPYPTENVNQTVSSWTCGSTCTVSTVQGPDGASDAGELTTTASPSGSVVVYSGSFSTSPGDIFIYGVWERPGANETRAGSAFGYPFSLYSYGTDTFVNGSYNPDAFGTGYADNWWHPVVAIAEIASGESTSHSIKMSLYSGQSVGQGNQFYDPFLIYIPASANIPTDEIMRWRQELLHGYVPSNLTTSGAVLVMAPSHKLYWGNDTDLYRGAAGVVQTDGAFNALKGYQCNGSSGTSGQVMSTTGSGCQWITPPVAATGVTTLSSGTATVNTPAACTVGSSCNYQLTHCASSGTLGILSVGAVTPGTSFAIESSSNTDTSEVCWRIN